MTSTITGNKRKYSFEDTSSPEKKKIKVSRQVSSFASNKASGIERVDSPSKLDERIKLHAQERIAALGTLFYAYYKKWERSDGTLRKCKVTVKRAKRQVGQGTRAEHAAHSNAFSGILDNLLNRIFDDIEQKQAITPNSDKIISRCLSPTSQKAVRRLDFSNVSSAPSLIDNSELSYLLNGTHVLPTKVNLSVDRPLENHIRPIGAEWLEKVGVGEMLPDDALFRSKEAIEKFLEGRIQELKDSQADEKLIKYTELELEGIKELNLKLLIKYLFSEFKDEAGNVDFDKTLRLLDHF